MSVEYMLAARTARYDKGSRAAVMMRIAALSVSLGVAVMILTLAVITGFRHEIYSDLRGFSGDIRIFEASGLGRSESEPVAFSATFLERLRRCGHVVSAVPYAVAGGMAKSGDQVAGIQVKGVDGDSDLSWWRGHLVEGDMPAVGGGQRVRELLLSRAMARKLRVGAGDRLELLFIDGDRTPRRDRFRVSGIYHTGLEELDGVVALTDLRNVRRLASWDDDAVSGYEIVLDSPSAADEAAELIDDAADEAFYAGDTSVASCMTATMEVRYPVVFDWLKAHGVNARVIIAIMMIVVLFNMTSAMLIMVLDRTGMIGTLKAAGMRNASVRRIFLWRAAMLFVRGAVWGNVAGLGLVAVQVLFEPVTLNPSGYMLSVLPVRVEPWWWLALNAGALAVTTAAMTVPSMIVARISPAESLKYKQ